MMPSVNTKLLCLILLPFYHANGTPFSGEGSNDNDARSFIHYHGPVEGPALEVTIKTRHEGKIERNGLANEEDSNERNKNYIAHPRYEFSYGVIDLNSGDVHGQKESRDGDNVIGEYTIKEPGGNIRTVRYTSDKHGFKAKVQNSGINTHSNYEGERNNKHHQMDKHGSSNGGDTLGGGSGHQRGPTKRHYSANDHENGMCPGDRDCRGSGHEDGNRRRGGGAGGGGHEVEGNGDGIHGSGVHGGSSFEGYVFTESGLGVTSYGRNDHSRSHLQDDSHGMGHATSDHGVNDHRDEKLEDHSGYNYGNGGYGDGDNVGGSHGSGEYRGGSIGEGTAGSGGYGRDIEGHDLQGEEVGSNEGDGDFEKNFSRGDDHREGRPTSEGYDDDVSLGGGTYAIDGFGSENHKEGGDSDHESDGSDSYGNVSHEGEEYGAIGHLYHSRHKRGDRGVHTKSPSY